MKFVFTFCLIGLLGSLPAQTLMEATDTYGGDLLYFENQPKTNKGAFGVTIGSVGNKTVAVQWNDRQQLLGATDKYVGKYRDLFYSIEKDPTGTIVRGYTIGAEKLEPQYAMLGGDDFLAQGFPSSKGYSILLSTPTNDSTCTAFGILDELLDVRYSQRGLREQSCKDARVQYLIDGDYLVQLYDQGELSKTLDVLTFNVLTGEQHRLQLPGAGNGRQRIFFKGGMLLISRYLPEERKTDLRAYNTKLDSVWTSSFGFGVATEAWAYEHAPALLLFTRPGKLYRVERAGGAAREYDLSKIISGLPSLPGGFGLLIEAFVDLEDGRQLLAFRQIDNRENNKSNVFLAEFDRDFTLKQLQEFKYTSNRKVYPYQSKENVFFTVGPQVFVFPKK